MDSSKRLFLGGKGTRFINSQKIGFFLILLVIVWGFYLLRLTALYDEGKHRDSAALKTKIIELSKKYIATLSREHTIAQLDAPLDGRSLKPCEWTVLNSFTVHQVCKF